MRFPETFCFQLTVEEVINLKSQIVTSSLRNEIVHGGTRYLPYVLTEQGIMMLSGLLKSDIAVKVNVQIIDAFVAMRKYISSTLVNQKFINNLVYKHDEEIKLLKDSFDKLQEKTKGIDYNRKDDMIFISMIRLPDFVSKEDFDWAIEEATKKKKQDFSRVEFLTYEEGLCVQCMHVGSYDDEPITVRLMHEYIQENGYELDITDTRFHHEIYLSDPRKCEVNKLKTVIRHPIKKMK